MINTCDGALQVVSLGNCVGGEKGVGGEGESGEVETDGI